MKPRRKLKKRETVLLGIVALLALLLPVLVCLVLPAYRQWGALRQRVALQQREHQRYQRSLALKSEIEREFAKLAPEVFQRESDQVMLSAWLRDLEAAARKSGITLISMRPMTMQPNQAHKSYPVKFSVSGTLPQVLSYVDATTGGARAVKLETFTLRGISGINMVECTLAFRLIALIDPATGAKKAGDAGAADQPRNSIARGTPR